MTDYYCRMCEDYKDESLFYPRGDNRQRRQSVCIGCDNTARRKETWRRQRPMSSYEMYQEVNQRTSQWRENMFAEVRKEYPRAGMECDGCPFTSWCWHEVREGRDVLCCFDTADVEAVRVELAGPMVWASADPKTDGRARRSTRAREEDTG